MSPYEIRLLLFFYSRSSADGMPPESEFARTDHFFSTLHSLARRELLTEYGTRDELYAISPRGSAYVAALQRVQLPVQTWVMPDAYPHATSQPEERYYNQVAPAVTRDVSLPIHGTRPTPAGTLTGWTTAPTANDVVGLGGALIDPARREAARLNAQRLEDVSNQLDAELTRSVNPFWRIGEGNPTPVTTPGLASAAMIGDPLTESPFRQTVSAVWNNPIGEVGAGADGSFIRAVEAEQRQLTLDLMAEMDRAIYADSDVLEVTESDSIYP